MLLAAFGFKLSSTSRLQKVKRSMRPRHSSKLSNIPIVRWHPKYSEAAWCFLLKGLTLSLLLALGSTSVSALPVGGVVTWGSASINTTPGSRSLRLRTLLKHAVDVF